MVPATGGAGEAASDTLRTAALGLFALVLAYVARRMLRPAGARVTPRGQWHRLTRSRRGPG